MMHKENLEYLLSDVQNLETLVKGLLQEEFLPVQSLSRTCNLAYTILEKLKAIESEQLQQLNIRLVEQQEELNHLSVLLEQYRTMAETYKANIRSAKQELEAAEKAKQVIPPMGKPAPAEEMLQNVTPKAKEVEAVKPLAEEMQTPVAEKSCTRLLHDVLGKQNLADFRKAFSLNDRFRFRRELFHGDETLMNQVIMDLNQTVSLQEAMDYIKKHLSWDFKEEAVADFMKLLEKRYV